MKYLTPKQFQELLGYTNNHRDKALLTLAYNHGLRVSELISLKWSQIDINEQKIFVERLKGSKSTWHPLYKSDITCLAEIPRVADTVFVNRQKQKLSRQAVSKIVAKLAKLSGLSLSPHTLRHSCGYKLAQSGLNAFNIAEYLGHANLNNSLIYCRTNVTKFNNLF